MEKLTFNKLPDIHEVIIEENFRFDIPKGRAQFLCRALYDNLYVFPKANILYAVIIILAAVSSLIYLEFSRLLYVFLFLLILKGTMAFLINRQYSSFKESGIFPVINRNGISQVATYAEYGRYVTVTDVRWEDIEAVRFYSGFISVQIKDRKDIQDGGRLIYIMTEDAMKFKNAVACLWKEALKNSNQKNTMMLYSEKEEKEITEYITEHFGAFEHVLHEIIVPDVHLDIAIIPASKKRNYITLCTIGAGAYTMKIDEETRVHYGLPQHAEYVIHLPADWKIDDESLKDERYYWPFRALKDTARIPICTDAWLGYGHTIEREEGTLLVQGKPFSSILLTFPAPEFGNIQYADLSTGKSICFFHIHPITPEELDYKIENDADDLLDRIYPENCDVMEIFLDRMKP